MQKLELELQGMGCNGCVANVRRALGELSEVSVEDVTIGRALVAFEPGRTSPQQIATKLSEAGYPVKSATPVAG
jgi:copper chaperone CopZ